MNYQETLDFLYAQLPMYQRIGKAAYKADLETTRALDLHFGHPHRDYRCIHVAGTNGKGSVSHLLASVLQEAGYRTGLYTSPHLLDFRERIRVSGKLIGEERVIEFVEENKELITALKPSFFEMTVAMAFEHFSREKVEVAVIETGMGGRLDSTNVVDPLLSIITNISMDHSEFLGDIPEKIAVEKGGIIKQGRPLVLGPMDDGPEKVLQGMALEREAPVYVSRDHYRPLFQTLLRDGKARFVFSRGPEGGPHSPEGGPHSPEGGPHSPGSRQHSPEEGNLSLDCGLTANYQAENLATALTALDVLRRASGEAGGKDGKGRTELCHTPLAISDGHMERGLAKVVENTGLLGRWQVLGANPRWICDTAHNEAGVRAVIEQIRQTPYRNLHMVWGMVGDKDPDRILPLLPSGAAWYFTRASIPRSMDPGLLRERAAGHGLRGESWPDVPSACRAARDAAGEDDLVFCGGSTFVVADLLQWLGY